MPGAARRLALIAAGTAAVFTLAVSVAPSLRFAYRSESAHVALETAAGLIVGLAAYLVIQRFRRSALLSDLLLGSAFSVLAITNLLLAAIPQIAAGDPGEFAAWGSAAGGVLGIAMFAAAAALPERTVGDPGRAIRLAALACVAALASAGTLVALLAGALPPAVDPGLSPEMSGRPHITGNGLVPAIQAASTVLLVVACLGFLHRARERDDEMLGWFAVAAALAAFSRVNYLLFPSIYTEWVYTGDILRLAFYLVLLIGALREIAGYQPRLQAAAVLEERRRLARDLHDGLAQELAYISAQVETLRERGEGGSELGHVSDAAQRALEESRMAISALSRPTDEPLEVMLGDIAESLARRSGARVALELDEGISADLMTREALLRILREAMSNAVVHGRATAIRVRLRAGRDLELSVSDDGVGFDAGNGRSGVGQLGLVSMRERAEALGGSFALHSRPGSGTRVEVVVPR